MRAKKFRALTAMLLTRNNPMTTMLSKYAGTCKTCGCQIRKGESITWSRKLGAQHGNCARMTGRCTKGLHDYTS